MNSRTFDRPARQGIAPPGLITATRAVQCGFTLIEVLVAIALMAIVSVLAWRGLDSVIRTRDYVQRQADRDDALLRVLGQLQQDMQMRAPDAVLNGVAGKTVVARALPAAVNVKGRYSSVELEIVRGPLSAGQWQRVRWWRDGDVLRRAVAPGGNGFPLPEPGAGADVLDGIASFGVEAWIPDRGWIPLPDNHTASAATGLAFVVELAGPTPGVAQPPYRRVVTLQ